MKRDDQAAIEISKAIELLAEWHRWATPWRPNLGVPKIAPYCKDARISRQYDDATDLTHDRVYKMQMDSVQFCVFSLPTDYIQSITTEIRNRETNARVWRSPSDVPFNVALDTVIVVMRKEGLFD